MKQLPSGLLHTTISVHDSNSSKYVLGHRNSGSRKPHATGSTGPSSDPEVGLHEHCEHGGQHGFHISEEILTQINEVGSFNDHQIDARLDICGCLVHIFEN